MTKHIFLIGFMGVGKSTIARSLASALSCQQLEMDERIEQQEGQTISEIFQHHGERYFRDLETALLRDLLSQAPAVVSCGGGSVLREENVKLMKQMGTIVLLTASPESIYARVKNSQSRPILNGHMHLSYIQELMEKRRRVYESAADVTVSTDGKTPLEISREVRACTPHD